ncbi:Predicted ATPase [Micromonospora pattaloongensis]|uniref:Predicted ATPase n=1 Tax=Micromonospora pattaloongensis TaxID=405436 RepID=A0A1H3JPP4_9ACTN|nr:tetratricopeptide repeat protein [Micromonospora pattaloongensis]SDY41338.1 Predicted ATPase [Micromonospora pattaloongensis]
MPADDPDELLRHFCADLRLLWTQAQGPSLRVVSARVGLGKSQVGAILNGTVRRPPDWDVVRRLVQCFHDHARAHHRLSQLSLRTGVEETWRPRYAMLEYAFQRRRTPPGGTGSRPPTASRRWPVPRQLPPVARHLVGRAAELATLDRAAASCGKPDGSATVVVIDGTAGVGKTTVALWWAHRAGGRFPDGQLHVDLGGFDPNGTQVSPENALRGFLIALGADPHRLPDDLSTRVALYRSLLADRRVLVVLDNARDPGQVRPLLPGGPSCMALVTSRNQLTGLVVGEGALPLRLELPTPTDAAELFASRLGTGRAAEEPAAVAEIVDRCARLPLAVAIAAASAAARPDEPLAALAAQLRTGTAVLDTLSTGTDGADVRTAFSWSYRRLSPIAATLFRTLGLHPGPDVTVAAAASLAGVPVRQVRPALAELARAHLVSAPHRDRYRTHDLLRAYAMELARATDPGARRRMAQGRLLDHLLHTAYAASRMLDPQRHTIAIPPPDEGVTVVAFSDEAAALDWYAAEETTLVAAIHGAARTGFHARAWQLTWACEPMLYRQVPRQQWAALQRVALAAARRIGDPLAQGHAHRGLGRAYSSIDNRRIRAHIHFNRALRNFATADRPVDEGYVRFHLSLLCERNGEYRAALEHTRRALELFERAGHRPGQARAYNGLGWQHALLGDYEVALVSCARALDLMRAVGDLLGQAQAWDSIGFAHHGLRQYGEAVTAYRRALALIRRIGERNNEAEMLVHLGDTHQAAGSPEAAGRAWRQALTILDELGVSEAAAVRARLDGTPLARPAAPPG